MLQIYNPTSERDHYYLRIADAVATGAKCLRRQVGAVLVDTNNRVLSIGKNGSPPGHAECTQGACPRGLLSYEEVAAHSSYDEGPGRCISVHAEINALLYARTSCEGAIAYLTYAPCPSCMKALMAAGVGRVVVSDSVIGSLQ